ncbi:uncharacterized protein NP_0850A [Natronomonas pharaonis DSM 2160]|uniref:Uncharacterized protein n=1 Tax=Natronomonas pharaonis (strain ATCC 35678 / DSM 2160 / CIP 103997 / JCM 8858 / NBRC 14720 / NCIMB 2260 / Gabara) TaxID=348780 RepID=A0A1U7EU98_NATPD|nr:hypothetical protein [Natronomonas pharaonis]CAI48516.1 uncharacterized protein NP_0850A [Natronomonas pharaonis DSM 2160]
MASLTEVYEGGSGAGLRRLYAGVVLFGVGVVLVTTGILIASTGLGAYVGLGLYEAREVAGILGGVGLPAVLLGMLVALPRAARELQVGVGAGAVLCLIGVGMFRRWYPVDWVGASGNTTMTLVVAATYFAGAIVMTWSLFTAVANFKARNDPGGTVKLEVTKGGETKVVEVSNDDLRGTLGGIGLLGGQPEGDVETQTNDGSRDRNRNKQATGGGAGVGSRSSDTRRRTESGSLSPRSSGGSGSPSRSSSRGSSSRSRQSRSAPGPAADASATDGGATDEPSIQTPGDDAEFLDDGPETPSNDRYCGNCTHFRYARTDDGLVPYCGLHSEAMDDMDACDKWSPNTK